MIDYETLARAYGRLGGLDRTATLIKAIRAERGDDAVLLLDGGDTWQGSYTSLKTRGADMVSAMKLLKPDAMVGHWEFTFGQNRVEELIEDMGYPFLGGNVFDTEWDEQVFESTAFFRAWRGESCRHRPTFPLYADRQTTPLGRGLVLWNSPRPNSGEC